MKCESISLWFGFWFLVDNTWIRFEFCLDKMYDGTKYIWYTGNIKQSLQIRNLKTRINVADFVF